MTDLRFQFQREGYCANYIMVGFEVTKATLAIAGHGQSVSLQVTLFNIIIMTSYQPSLEASVYLNVLHE